jgi:RNA polymerase sigma-70 factor (ECF subfamily)
MPWTPSRSGAMSWQAGVTIGFLIQNGVAGRSYLHQMSCPIDQHGRRDGKRDLARGDIASAYRAHAAALYRYAIMITADAAAAEDAIQQVFVKLVGRKKVTSLGVAERSYLRIAVRNECYRILNRRRREPVELEGGNMIAPAGSGPADPEEQAMVEQALRRLPPDQREVIHMKIYEQLTFQEIADQLGESINTIAGRYRYGLAKLRQWLTPCREDAI